jgi:hypothetical protein
VPLPAGISDKDKPSWAEQEFNVGEMHAAHLMAIVHSKTIVIDPFSDNCAVVTGSHNFSDSASAKNDENLVIIKGNKQLAQAYALHINGVYDHYSWRAYLGSGGDPDQIYKPLDGWKPGGGREQELDFWMQEPVPPQKDRPGSSSGSGADVGAKSRGAKASKKAPKKAVKKAAKKTAKKPPKSRSASRKTGKAAKARPAAKTKKAKTKKAKTKTAKAKKAKVKKAKVKKAKR